MTEYVFIELYPILDKEYEVNVLSTQRPADAPHHCEIYTTIISVQVGRYMS